MTTTTLRAAPALPVLSDERRSSLLTLARYTQTARAEAFLASLEVAEFVVTTGVHKDGRLSMVGAWATAKFANPGDHRMAEWAKAAGWLFTDAVAAGGPVARGKIKADWTGDTRSREASITFSVTIRDVAKADVEALTQTALLRLKTALPSALSQGIALARAALVASDAAAEANHALSTAAKGAVDEAEAAMGYNEKLKALREERAKLADERLGHVGFTDLSPDAVTLIDAEARKEALRRALTPSPFMAPDREPVVAPKF